MCISYHGKHLSKDGGSMQKALANVGYEESQFMQSSVRRETICMTNTIGTQVAKQISCVTKVHPLS